jgi:hypothetical protein
MQESLRIVATAAGEDHKAFPWNDGNFYDAVLRHHDSGFRSKPKRIVVFAAQSYAYYQISSSHKGKLLSHFNRSHGGRTYMKAQKQT